MKSTSNDALLTEKWKMRRKNIYPKVKYRNGPEKCLCVHVCDESM